MTKPNNQVAEVLFLLGAILRDKNKASQKEHAKAVNTLLENYKHHDALVSLQQCLRAFDVPFEGSDQIPTLEVRYHTPPENYGKYFNRELYNKSYALCHFAKKLEGTGIEEENATKLAMMFNESKSMLSYLAEFSKSHQYSRATVRDACMFELPDFTKEGFLDEKNGCKFEIFKNLAAVDNNLLRPDFKELLPYAWELQKLVIDKTKQAKEKNQKRDVIKIKEKEKAIKELVGKQKELERHKIQVINEDEKAKEYHELPRELRKNLCELADLLSGKFLKDMSFLELKAIFEEFKINTMASSQMFMDYGIPAEYHAEFMSLNRQDAGVHIPNVTIDGATLGHPGFYFMKVPVWDNMQAARAACFGKITECCQSLSGEAGHFCVRHGLTSPYGGFYVLCKGDSKNPKVDDPVVAQSWVWRSKTGAIVFDSIEAVGEVKEKPELVDMVTQFYNQLSRELVDKNHTTRVVCGNSVSGLPDIVGVAGLFSENEESVDYDEYIDSIKQSVIYDKECPYFIIRSNEELEACVKKLNDSVRDNNIALRDNPKIVSFIHWLVVSMENAANLEQIQNITNLVNKIFEQEAFKERQAEFRQLMSDIENYIYSEEKPELPNDVYLINIKKEKGDTALMRAAYEQDEVAVKHLVELGADVNAKTFNGVTALMGAAQNHGSVEILQTLLEAGANASAIDLKRFSALTWAIMAGNLEGSLILLQHTKIFSPSPDFLIKEAADRGLEKVCVKILETIGYKNYCEAGISNPPTFELLTTAIKDDLNDLAQGLIDNDIAINKPNKRRETPLMLCLEKKNYVLAEKLIDKGATYESSSISYYLDDLPDSLLIKIIMKEPNILSKNKINSTLLAAASQGNTELCRKLIDTYSIDVNQVCDKDYLSCLSLAARNGHAKTCELLIEKGATVFEVNGPIALLEAQKAGHQAVLKLLSNHIKVEPDNFDMRMFFVLIASELNDVALKMLKNHNEPAQLLEELAVDINQVPQWRSDEVGHISKMCVFLLRNGVKPDKKTLENLKKVNQENINEALAESVEISKAKPLRFSKEIPIAEVAPKSEAGKPSSPKMNPK